MEIVIVCVGKIKEKYLVTGIEHYIREIKKTIPVSIIQMDDEKAPENLSVAMEEQVKDHEGEKLLRVIKDDMYVITLEILGKEVTTDAFIKVIKKAGQANKDRICFVIGGSLGLSEAVLKRSNTAISFSKMTFPHQLMRLILVQKIAEIRDYL